MQSFINIQICFGSFNKTLYLFMLIKRIALKVKKKVYVITHRRSGLFKLTI